MSSKSPDKVRELAQLMTVRQLTIKLRERGEGSVEKYLSVPEMAEYLNTSERFARWLIAERRIVFHHVGRHVRVALSDLDLWLACSRAVRNTAVDDGKIKRNPCRIKGAGDYRAAERPMATVA